MQNIINNLIQSGDDYTFSTTGHDDYVDAAKHATLVSLASIGLAQGILGFSGWGALAIGAIWLYRITTIGFAKADADYHNS